MSKTLKEKYRQRSAEEAEHINSCTATKQRKDELRKTLKLIEESVDPRFKKFLLEGFDTAEAEQVVKQLDNIADLATKYKADELNRAAKEAEKVARKLVGLEGKGPQWLAKSLGSLTKGLLPRIKDVFDFTGLVTQGLKGIAPALKLTIGREMEAKDKSADSLADVLKFNQRDSTKKAMKQAFLPSGFFKALKGVPFLNVDKLVDQLIRNNSYNELVGIKAPAKAAFSKEDYQELEKGLKGDNEVLKKFLASISDEEEETVAAPERPAKVNLDLAKEASKKIQAIAANAGWGREYINNALLARAKKLGFKAEIKSGKFKVQSDGKTPAAQALYIIFMSTEKMLRSRWENMKKQRDRGDAAKVATEQFNKLRDKFAATGLSGKELADAIENAIFRKGKELGFNVIRTPDGRVDIEGDDRTAALWELVTIFDDLLDEPMSRMRIEQEPKSKVRIQEPMRIAAGRERRKS